MDVGLALGTVGFMGLFPYFQRVLGRAVLLIVVLFLEVSLQERNVQVFQAQRQGGSGEILPG